MKYIINDNKHYIEHKHLILFSYYHFKGIFSSKHILIDWHTYSPLVPQTMILIHYVIIFFKFIPGIFILTYNKIYNGYKHIFRDIIELIENYEEETNNSLNWEKITAKFENALINAIDTEIIRKKNKYIDTDVYFIILKILEKHC